MYYHYQKYQLQDVVPKSKSVASQALTEDRIKQGLQLQTPYKVKDKKTLDDVIACFSDSYNNLVIQVMKQRIDEGSIYIGTNYAFPSSPLVQQSSSGPTPFTVDYSQSGNAFANLRNEITNLKLEFSKLVQKDAAGYGDALKKRKQGPEQRETIWHRRENRISSQYQSEGCQIQKKFTDSNGIFHFQGYKNSGQRFTNQKENASFRKKEEGISRQLVSKIEGNIMSQAANGVFDGQLSVHQNEIGRLNESKVKLQQKIHALNIEIDQKTCQFEAQLQEMRGQRNKWKEAAEKAEISLSLKDSLIDKLEQSLKTKQEEKILLQKQSLAQYQTLSEQYIKCQLELDHSATHLKIEIQSLQQQISLLKSVEAQSSLQITQLQQEVEQLRQHSKNISHPKSLLFARAEEPELADLKKRVEAYQRSIEHLNSANTVNRQKLAQAQLELNQVRQDLKRSQAKAESLLEENNIKQALISSLYRDISILDKQIRQIAALKATLVLNEKSIDALNETIIQLQCEKHNYRYSHILQE